MSGADGTHRPQEAEDVLDGRECLVEQPFSTSWSPSGPAAIRRMISVSTKSRSR
jgi:hypothetical protein